MKKILYLLYITIITSMLLTGCGSRQSESPAPSSPAVTSPAAVTAAPEDSAEIPESASVPDGTANSKSNSDERAEITKMIKDAQELIDEDLIDDANMLIRDLLTRDLTDEEKSQVEALRAKTVKISD